LASTSTEIVSSSNGTSAIIKPFSRQHVISTCEMSNNVSCEDDDDDQKSVETSSGSSEASMPKQSSSHAHNDAEVDDNVDDDGSIELDEFGDVVPAHLRKKNKQQVRKKRKKQVYQVQEAEQKNLQNVIDKDVGDDGWGTDF
jgi:hypothetical protein